MGALGGPTADEYLHGGPRVTAFLEQTHASVRRWTAPEPDALRPEAEWGFEKTLDSAIEAFAQRNGYRVERLSFSHPEELSPLIADLHAKWYGEHGIEAKRLLVESFILMDPHRALRAGLVPFWMFFNMLPSHASLTRYLDGRPPFDEIAMMLFSLYRRVTTVMLVLFTVMLELTASRGVVAVLANAGVIKLSTYSTNSSLAAVFGRLSPIASKYSPMIFPDFPLLEKE